MNKLYYAIPLGLILFFLYGILNYEEKNPIKNKTRIPCQNKTTTFEKISNKKLVEEAINLLKSGNYTIKAKIEKAVYMKSKILDYISIEKANKILEDSIKKVITEKKLKNKKLLIDYYILENDKEDKGKKGTACKLYAGYLVFEFKLENKLIYKIQTDYMQIDTSDIPERMDCIIKSFITIKG